MWNKSRLFDHLNTFILTQDPHKVHSTIVLFFSATFCSYWLGFTSESVGILEYILFQYHLWGKKIIRVLVFVSLDIFRYVCISSLSRVVFNQRSRTHEVVVTPKPRNLTYQTKYTRFRKNTFEAGEIVELLFHLIPTISLSLPDSMRAFFETWKRVFLRLDESFCFGDVKAGFFTTRWELLFWRRESGFFYDSMRAFVLETWKRFFLK